MRIGILTFHAAGNYGAFLQAYSLLSALNGLQDTEARIIDYVCPPIEENYLPEKYLKRKGNPVKNILLFLLRSSVMKQQNQMFAEARRRNYQYDAERVTRQTLEQLNYDFYIVGSDQVWNEELTNGDKVYYLDFVKDNSKKLSYAVSIGNDSEHPFSESVSVLIQKFSAICLREQKTTEFMKHLFPDKEIHCCIDPVFLTSSQKWRKFSAPVKDTEKYILIFAMGNGKTADKMVDFGRQYAAENNCRILFLSDQEKWYKHRDLRHLVNITPEQFVWLIDHAEAVVTNSFHATAFSIILNKTFFVETAVKRNGRIYDLLDRFSLASQALKEGKKLTPETEAIHWELVNERIQHQKDAAFSYLNTILHGNNGRF